MTAEIETKARELLDLLRQYSPTLDNDNVRLSQLQNLNSYGQLPTTAYEKRTMDYDHFRGAALYQDGVLYVSEPLRKLVADEWVNLTHNNIYRTVLIWVNETQYCYVEYNKFYIRSLTESQVETRPSDMACTRDGLYKKEISSWYFFGRRYAVKEYTKKGTVTASVVFADEQELLIFEGGELVLHFGEDKIVLGTTRNELQSYIRPGGKRVREEVAVVDHFTVYSYKKGQSVLTKADLLPLCDPVYVAKLERKNGCVVDLGSEEREDCDVYLF